MLINLQRKVRFKRKKNNAVDETKEGEALDFFPTTNSNQRQTQYVRFEDKSAGEPTLVHGLEPRNTGKILNGVDYTLFNSTRNTIQDTLSSSYYFLTNFLSTKSILNDGVAGVRLQQNTISTIDAIDDFDHKSGYTSKVRIIKFSSFSS